MKWSFQIGADPTVCDRVCDVLKDRLRVHIGDSKRIKPFMDSFASELMLQQGTDAIPTYGGFGLKYHYPGDAKKNKERTKLKYWLQYFGDNGRNMAMIMAPKALRLIRIGLPSVLRGEVWEMTSGAVW